MAALRSVSGELVTDGRQMARLMADAFSAFSIDPAPAATAEVLGAIREHATPVPKSSARAVGAAEVKAEEVQKAAHLTQPGTAPSPDGLPLELWRRGGEALYPLLARVFSAVGQLGTIPEEMLEEVVSLIFKAGCSLSRELSPHHPAQHRLPAAGKGHECAALSRAGRDLGAGAISLPFGGAPFRGQCHLPAAAARDPA